MAFAASWIQCSPSPMHTLWYAIRQQYDFSLSLWGQPICPVAEPDNCQWYELLLRLHDPRHGILYPIDFLPDHDQTMLCLAVDWWVLSETARIMRQHPQLSFSINFSRHLLADFALFERIDRTFFGINTRGRLTLEISEQDLDWANKEIWQLEHLQAVVKLSVDDVGQAPLKQLSDLSGVISGFKIDGSLIERVLSNDMAEALVDGLIRLAWHSKLICVCEFVSDVEIWQWVLSRAQKYPGVELYCQGFAVGDGFRTEWQA